MRHKLSFAPSLPFFDYEMGDSIASGRIYTIPRFLIARPSIYHFVVTEAAAADISLQERGRRIIDA